MAEIPEELLDQVALNVEHRTIMRELGLRSYMVVPMVARGRSHGAITLVSAESGRRYEETDLRLAEELARRTALAVDNAKLYEEAQREISERRDAEEALLQSEGRYRTVVKQAAEGIFVVDIDTKLILEANIAYRNLLGYTAQDMLGLGLTLYDVVAHDRKSIDLNLEQIQREGTHFMGERRHRRKDGSLVDVEVSSSVISYGGGKALCVIVHDITERKRSAERLQRSLDALLGLYEAGQILSSSLEREEIGSRLLEIASRVSNLTAAVISIPDEDGQLHIWRSSGLEGLWRQARFAPEAVAARQKVLETGKYQAGRLQQPEDWNESQLVSLNLPLLVRGRLIGVLEAYGPEALMERQYEETLISLANQGASALENARLYAELTERENRLQDLLRKLITAQEEERRKVSYEVHDGLAQTAAGAHQLLQAFARQHSPDSEKGRKDLSRVLQLVQQTVGEARYVIADLRPTALDDFGLAAAVRLQVEKISAQGSKVDYEEALGDERLPPEVETALFRVAQEALTNVHKHAPSARVRITLQRLNDSVRLQVRDWGPGFNPERITDGGGPGERLGLSSMRERMALLGGHLEVHSRPGEGTEVVAEIPSVQIDRKGG
jgi:PAS domain S-box-containing protein